MVVMQGLRIPETLPPLTGWITRLYVALWMAVLAITVVGVSGGAWYQLRQGVGSAYGLDTLGINIAPDRRIDHLGGDEVRVAGVRIGDRVLSVEGIAVPAGGPDSQFNQQLRLRTDQARGPLRLTIQTGHAPPHTLVLTRSMAHGDALYEGTGLTPVSLTRTSAFVGLLAPVVLVFGAILLFGRRRDPVAALLSVSLLSLATGTSFSSLFWGKHLNAIWVVDVMGTTGKVGLLLAMQTFPNGRLVPRWTFYLMVATSVSGIVGTFLPSIGSAPFFLLLLLTLVAMIVRYRRDTPDARRQWRWAMIGFVTGMALLIIAVFGYDAFQDSHHSFGVALWSWIVTPLTLGVPLTIIVAGVVLSVLRYRLYDTQAAVSRSILLGVLTLTLLAIFAGSEKIVELIGEEYFGESMGALAGGLGAAFAAVAIVPLHHRLEHWVEHHFRKNLIHLRHDLPPLIAELGETADPVTVARVALDHLGHGLHATRGAVVAKGTVLATHGIEATAINPQGRTRRPCASARSRCASAIRFFQSVFRWPPITTIGYCLARAPMPVFTTGRNAIFCPIL